MSTRAIPPLVALTQDSPVLPMGVLSQIAAALQKQVTRDFAPLWHQSATVAAFPTLRDVPLGYWLIVIKHALGEPGALGYHTDAHGQPIAFVDGNQSRAEIATTCSHELLEALADPWGSRLVVCTVPDVGRVRVLVEVCDPPEAATYDVDGWPMSDFVEPAFFGPHRWGKGVQGHDDPRPGLSFVGTIKAPLTVAPGGYMSYVKPDGSWWQTTWFGGSKPVVKNISGRLAELRGPAGSLRSAIDLVTHEARAAA